jgi:sugar phosphate isomerase/epimerase
MARQMTMSRRGLLGAGAGAAAGLALARGAGAAQAATGDGFSGSGILPSERIGLQLYSVRDRISSIGFAPVLEAVAEIGFKLVEFAGYTQGTGAITPAQIRDLLAANGLKAIGSHVSPSDDASMQQVLDDAQTIGIPNVGISFEVPSGATTADWQALADDWNHYGELAAQRKVGFYVHNHFQEFALCADDPTRRGIDVLLAETDPKLVFFELDLYWAYVGQWQFGQVVPFDPLRDYAIPFRDRFKLFHVKDGKRDASGGYANALDDMCDAGEGEIDFSAFFSALFAQGAKESKRHHYLWERDNASSHPRGSLAAGQISFLTLRYGIKQVS